MALVEAHPDLETAFFAINWNDKGKKNIEPFAGNSKYTFIKILF